RLRSQLGRRDRLPRSCRRDRTAHTQHEQGELMAAKRTGLGRGIGALIPTSEQTERPVDVFFPGASKAKPSTASGAQNDTTDARPELSEIPGVRLIQVDPKKIVPNPRQPRTHFDPDHLAELVHSVKEYGVLQPIVVRQNADGEY